MARVLEKSYKEDDKKTVEWWGVFMECLGLELKESDMGGMQQ